MANPEFIYEMNNTRRPFIFDYFKLNVYTGVRELVARGPDFGNMKGKATLGQSFHPDGTPMGVLIDEGLDRVLYEYDANNKQWTEK